MDQQELLKLINDPSSHYRHPKDVLNDQKLSKEEKYKILQSWDRECREMQVATEENMGGGDDNEDMLAQIEEAITKGLGMPLHLEDAAPTKHGG